MHAQSKTRQATEPVTFNLRAAGRMLEAVAGKRGPVFDFRCLPESPDAKAAGLPALLYRGRLVDVEAKLQAASEKGYGVFFQLNKADGKGIKRANIKRARAVPLDLDKRRLPDIWKSPAPDIVVETSPGRHQAFVLIEPSDIDAAEDAARRMAAEYGGDPSVCDAPHVFRVAGFPHWKTGEPFVSRLVKAPDVDDVGIDSPFGRRTIAEFNRLPPVREKGDDSDERATDGGRLSPDDLEALLDKLDVDDFAVDGGGDLHWRNLAMAASAATGGDPEALDVFQAWCAEDPDHASEEQQAEIENRWKSFDPNRPGGIGIGTLYKICRDHGVPEDVLRSVFGRDAADDFSDFDDAEGADQPHRYTAKSWDYFKALPDPRWQWQGVFTKRTYILVYGRQKTGKTYLVLSMSLTMATEGGEFCGLKLDSGRVLYIIAEGSEAGLRNRIEVWIRSEVKRRVPAEGLSKEDLAAKRRAERNTIEEHLRANLGVVSVRVPINEPKHVKALLQRNPGPWDFVVIDTLFRNTSGNVNDPKDSVAFAAGVDTIREKTGATVCVVAHEGKNSDRGVYGAMIQQANADGTILIKRKGNSDVRELRFVELRDGDDSQPDILYRLKPVVLGINDDGEQQACFVEFIGRSEQTSEGNGDALSDNEDKVLKALRDNTVTKGADIEAATGLTRQQVRTVLKRLREFGYVTEDGYKLTKEGEAMAADLRDSDDDQD